MTTVACGIFMYVWEPFVETYMMMGWYFTANPLIYKDRGGHPSWLMHFPCECKVPYLKDRARLLGERERASR